MKKSVAITLLGTTAVVALLLSLLAYRNLSPPTMTQTQMSEQGLFVFEQPRPLAEFALLDSNNQPFGKQQLQGHWTLMFFGYTSCPDVCPTTLAAISRFHHALTDADADAGANLQVVFVSVDPKRDTAEKLAAYVHYFGESYVGTTGEFSNIFAITRQLNLAFGYVPGKNGEYEVTHSGEIALINPAGEFHGFFKSPPDPLQMQATYRAMLSGWE
jgi:protein SCO1